MPRIAIASPLVILALLAGGLRAADEELSPLEPERPSRRAAKDREEATALWEKAQPVFEQSRTREPAAPEAVREALARMEQAAALFEEALHEEWRREDNDTLAEIVRAWFELRASLPPPPEPGTDEEREELQERLEDERKDRVRAARKFLLDVLQARKVRKQFSRCGRCDGRGEMLGAFGDRTPCPRCRGARMNVDVEGVLEAHWLPMSPLHRADSRHAMRFERMVRAAQRDSQRLAPFVYSASVEGDIEDHDVWVRILIEEKLQPQAHQGRTEKRETPYILYRVGETWWLWRESADRDLFPMPEEEPEED